MEGTWSSNLQGGAAGNLEEAPSRAVEFMQSMPCLGVKFLKILPCPGNSSNPHAVEIFEMW